MYTIDRFFVNLVENYKFLERDFIGISFKLSDILHIPINLSVAFFITFTLYLVGRKLRLIFLSKIHLGNLKIFVSFGLGYIALGTGIAILGILSILYSQIITIYFITVVLFAFYPFNISKDSIKELLGFMQKLIIFLENNKWMFIGIFAFILISFLRLIPPEIGEDAIGYHTDLPILYLKNHTMLVKNVFSEAIPQVIPAPQLGETLYLITNFLNIKDSSRYIHFFFYIFSICVIYCIVKNKNVGFYSIILFVTAPVVIRHATKANVDFQALFCWLLAVFLLIKDRKYTVSNVILSGLFFGGALSTKLWELAFFPVFFLFIFFTNKNKLFASKLILLFLFSSILVSGLWYLRSYLITGNPVFPALAFDKSSYVGINLQMFHYVNLVGYSPLFYVGLIFSIIKFPQLIAKFKKITFTLFFILLAFEHFFIQYYLPRYLLNLYSISAIIVSFGVARFISTIKIGKYIFYSILGILFFYYFLNTLFVLPYGLGWADKDKYLTRVLSRDSSSYYDFDNLFDKYFSKNDLVAVYSLAGFYYAKFSYIDIGYIFDRENKSFDLLNKKGATKLLIRGGDIGWFCKKLELKECSSNKYTLLAYYSPKPLYLYSLDSK